jgi:transcriptional regulator with XRE-family HTH domain
MGRRCRACGASIDTGGNPPLCTACAAVSGRPPEPARTARSSALWLWTSPQARSALATGEIGVMVRTWRQVTGTSQQALAEQLGYDPSYISMIENGRREVADVATRRRLATHLGIPLHRVGVTDSEAADHIAMLQFGYSTLRLAVLARQNGHGADSVNELWPLVARIEARTAEGLVDHDLLLLLARARCELGVSLGYVLPEERLTFAIRWTGRALRLAEHLDDPSLHTLALRAHGNELRKANRRAVASALLAKAVTIAPHDQRPAALAQLARAVDDPTTFDETIAELLRCFDTHRFDDPIVGPTAVREIRLRGLLATNRVDQAASLLHDRSEPSTRVSPQWRIIEQITVAELLIAVGDIASAEPAMIQAVADAERHRLPHQIQRAIRAIDGHSSTVTEAATAALARLNDHRSTVDADSG